MKHTLALCIMLVSVFLATDLIQDPQASANYQEAAGDERVYGGQEVDTVAVIKNRKELDPSALGSSFDCPKKGKVTLRMVLRKTGKVTDIKVVKPMMCSFDEKAVKTAGKIRFVPATKDGQSVSMHFMVEYAFKW